jgi:hypothetical protein
VRRAAARAAIGLALAAGCLVPADPPASIPSALGDLAAAGFEFEADVRFRSDPYASCQGTACADLVVLKQRRTILVAKDAFRSEDALRAALLEIWERYREPRRGSTRDYARGAWRVLHDGPRVGIRDRSILRFTHHTYRQLWDQLELAERSDLPDPDSLPFP